jgi:hypothetical protein
METAGRVMDCGQQGMYTLEAGVDFYDRVGDKMRTRTESGTREEGYYEDSQDDEDRRRNYEHRYDDGYRGHAGSRRGRSERRRDSFSYP